ncbi:MAG: alpha-glucan family phosphorylase [Candidatus Latescibacteria bacterium]|nr:alpha-glucan family phosphorylase [Candidatus Latescibacterota bacterium]
MHPVESFFVKASLPEKLESMRDVAYNLWWYWNVQAVKLFYRLEPGLWEEKYHNPVNILGNITQSRLDVLASDEGIQAHLERVKSSYDIYMNESTWYSRTISKDTEKKIAYFSLEFGLAECVPIYSGGLGILAGDHLKSASDLGLPLVGVGLLYQEGYFRQYLNNDGWQQEMYPDNDFYNMPVMPVTDKKGEELIIELEYPDGPVHTKVWKITVGRVPLYLLDTNISQNTIKNRGITSALYGGDQEMRLKQEMLLGVGGLRALYAMDIWPTVCHMNEGHAAFLALERIRTLMENESLTFDEALELAKAGNVFTTHTPVEAGHDRFPPALVLKYFDHFYSDLGLTAEEFLSLGKINQKSTTEPFCMTVLALKCADKSNAVSRLHMHVSREMWESLWPGYPRDEIPISHITNGIHVASWVSQDMVELFERYLGPRWRNEPACEEIWARINDIPDEEIWRTHERRVERLVSFARNRLYAQLKRRGSSEAELNLAQGALNSETLTIGFARRFATYKRADLIFRDISRLTEILTNTDRPVQFIFAGKAHPRDDEGKDIIRRIVHWSRRPDIRRHVVFIEDYDMCVARYLVQGVDVWLNTPRRPLEASGTSGMKAAANGALNLSILDGWWDEAYESEVGWAIGSGEVYKDSTYQDNVESNALYNVLEKDIIPLFYDISTDGLPRRWIKKMKTAMSRLLPVFNTDRMVHEYSSKCYQPSIERYNQLIADNAAKAREFALWKQKVLANWDHIKIVKIESGRTGEFKVGGRLNVTAIINLGKLEPNDVAVELYGGLVDAAGSLVDASPIRMDWKSKKSSDHIFEGALPFVRSGKIGYSLRIIPSHPDSTLYHNHMAIKWA